VGNARTRDWIQVRLRRSLWARLVAFRNRTAENAGRFPDRYPPFVTVDELSLSAAIELLLYRNDQHAARGKAKKRPTKLRIAEGT
jgi:hypothetical protein